MIEKIVAVIVVCGLLGSFMLFADAYSTADDQGRADLVTRALGSHPNHIRFPNR